MTTRNRPQRLPVERRLYSYTQAAEYLSIGVRTIKELAATGQIPKTPIGNRVLLDKADLDDFIERSKASA